MTKKQRDDSDDSDGALNESLSSSDSDESSLFPGPDKKRRKLNNKNDVNGDDDTEDDDRDNNDTGNVTTTESATKKKTVDPVLFEQAKSRLSKFAARLFDPNRIRGLVEGPITIPLNDEFLKAFGKREKKIDKLTGREEEFDQEIVDEDDNENDVGKETTTTTTPSKSKKQNATKVKVKINNLAYRTSKETLTNNCLRFGPVKEVHMILEGPAASNRNFHNSGRAYVTFESEDAAQSCLEGLKTLDGRPLRVSNALARPKTPKGKDGRASSASLLNNEVSKDISTICFRCKQVGHMESSCTNAINRKPCALCGMTDHDMRACPNQTICFNCGTPGHVSRDCTMRRGLPRRMVCGLCFQSGHHRLQCRMRSANDLPQSVSSSATCMTCGKKGHFLCKDLKWFYGLRGMSCFNCGSQAHSGYDCERPTLYQCINNRDATTQEIERAEADSVAEEFERQQQEQRERSRSRNRGKSNHGDGDGKKGRSKSSGGSRRDRRGY